MPVSGPGTTEAAPSEVLPQTVHDYEHPTPEQLAHYTQVSPQCITYTHCVRVTDCFAAQRCIAEDETMG